MKSITILGIFVADLAFFSKKIPNIGETIIGEKYVIGPGGKGSNQAVAAAKAGADSVKIQTSDVNESYMQNTQSYLNKFQKERVKH